MAEPSAQQKAFALVLKFVLVLGVGAAAFYFLFNFGWENLGEENTVAAAIWGIVGLIAAMEFWLLADMQRRKAIEAGTAEPYERQPLFPFVSTLVIAVVTAALGVYGINTIGWARMFGWTIGLAFVAQVLMLAVLRVGAKIETQQQAQEAQKAVDESTQRKFLTNPPPDAGKRGDDFD